MNVLMISGDRKFLREGDNASARLALQGSQVERLDVFGYEGISSAARGFFDIIRAATNVQYDVITAQEPFWRGLLAWFVARFSHTRLNIQVHTDLNAQPFLRRLLARIVLRHADSVRAVSEKIQKQVERMGVRAPVRVLPIFIELGQFRALERKPHVQKTMLWVGRFEPEKDPLRAIEVFKKVRDTGIDARLVMLGSGSMERKLRAAAERLPVEFPGWQDPKPYLQAADVVLSTSLHESWGASIVEALAAGVPVVAPNVGVAGEAGAYTVELRDMAGKVVEVLQHGSCGILLLNLPRAEEWAKQWRATLI